MGFDTGRIINYVVFDNPLSKGVTALFGNSKNLSAPSTSVTVINEKIPLWKLVNECGPFFRLGALMGASAVCIGAYGNHRSYPKDNGDEIKKLFESANRYHFFHSLALLSVPFCRNPKTAATLFISGVVLFSGSLYIHAFTGNESFRVLTPVGGTTLILAWISMVF